MCCGHADLRCSGAARQVRHGILSLAAAEPSVPSMTMLTLLSAAVLASVHLLGVRLTFLGAIPRSRWLSAAGGVSVAYVFVHILPELQEHQTTVEETGLLGFLEHHVYVAALAGLVIFYGLERLVREDELHGRTRGRHGIGVFWLHVVSFALYNGLIGYLLVHRTSESPSSLLLFLVALALHFVVNDHGLRQEHREAYHDQARWILAAAVLAGWGLGVATVMNPPAISLLFAVLAGGIVLNVLKEELPEERRSHFWAFLAGAAGYAGLLLLA
jgi:zinc transporter ZupT